MPSLIEIALLTAHEGEYLIPIIAIIWIRGLLLMAVKVLICSATLLANLSQCSLKPDSLSYSSFVLEGRGFPQKVNSGHGI